MVRCNLAGDGAQKVSMRQALSKLQELVLSHGVRREVSMDLLW